jgi:processive 1,2-diacylglycerol beta-glucosyltransferase
VLAAFKEKHGLATPLVGCVTDFVVHPYWLYPNVELYTVAQEDLKEDLVARGVPRERIRVTGIPIGKRFTEKEDKNELRRCLDLGDGRPVILVMGGGLGMGSVDWVVETVEDLRKPMHVVIFAGRNRKKLASLRNSLQNHGNPDISVKVLDYVDNVPEYMKAADLLVTKPGGLTSSEALACGLPFLIVRPLPGQEYRNTRYLVERKVARRVKGKKDLAQAIEQFLDNPQLIARIKERAAAMAVPDSASRIAQVILDLLPRAECRSDLRAAS